MAGTTHQPGLDGAAAQTIGGTMRRNCKYEWGQWRLVERRSMWITVRYYVRECHRCGDRERRDA
jgi:hypothetical protein